jgi:tRNA threonylcarbamoyladenosine biosynthesis protein TsaB
VNLLALDTSTEICSLALQHGDRSATHEAPGGAQTSAALIPAIQALLAREGLRIADLDAIAFGRGPGSFTGLRTACSVAQGLAFGAGIPVLPVDTLLAVAEDARERAGATQVVALLDARMDEVYWAAYAWGPGGWRQQGELRLGSPESVMVASGWVLAGNAFGACGGRLPDAVRIEAWPAAAALLRLAPALLAAGEARPASHALPRYVRDKVAQTTQERAAVRAAAKP